MGSLSTMDRGAGLPVGPPTTTTLLLHAHRSMRACILHCCYVHARRARRRPRLDAHAMLAAGVLPWHTGGLRVTDICACALTLGLGFQTSFGPWKSPCSELQILGFTSTGNHHGDCEGKHHILVRVPLEQ